MVATVLFTTFYFQSASKRWFVFGVDNQRQPYLEYYENEAAVFTSQPINTVLLFNCRHITRDFVVPKYSHVFTLTLVDRLLSLIAPSRYTT